MVYADTDSGMIGFTDVQKRNETVAYLSDFLRIFFIGIFQMFEGTRGIYVVTRIDTDFLRILRCEIGRASCRERV